MTNFKPVVGWSDSLATRSQNMAHTAYATGKMRAGRTPKDVNGNEIKNANHLYKPGLFYMSPGTTNMSNDSIVTSAPSFIYNLIEDPDDSVTGGHVVEDPFSISMNFRQIQYATSSTSVSVTTRTGEIDPAVAALGTNYRRIPTVQKIQDRCQGDSAGQVHYAYVEDIAQWIRYTVDAVSRIVDWEPAVQWSIWKSITGEAPLTKITGDITGEIGMHYVSFGNHTVELPFAGACTIGSTITLDQWAGEGTVFTKNALGEVQYTMNTYPAIKTVGLTDVKIHGDTFFEDDSMFVKSDYADWTYNDGTVYVMLYRAVLSDDEERFVIADASSGRVYRICLEDTALPSTEGSDTLHWYDVYSLNVTASAISSQSIAEVGTPTTMRFTIDDVQENILGCTTYIFEVAYTDPNSIDKAWVLARTSDMEAYIARINELYGKVIDEHDIILADLETSIRTGEANIDLLLKQYTDIERRIEVGSTGSQIYYGDNAKVSGEDLIVYNKDKWESPDSLTSNSYIVKYFLSRITPVYCIHKHDINNPRTIYLPTVNASMLGKKVKIILDPNTKVTVIDDCMTTKQSVLFYGEPVSEGQPVILKEIEYQLMEYTDRTMDTYKLAWVYTTRTYSTPAVF